MRLVSVSGELVGGTEVDRRSSLFSELEGGDLQKGSRRTCQPFDSSEDRRWHAHD